MVFWITLNIVLMQLWWFFSKKIVIIFKLENHCEPILVYVDMVMCQITLQLQIIKNVQKYWFNVNLQNVWTSPYRS